MSMSIVSRPTHVINQKKAQTTGMKMHLDARVLYKWEKVGDENEFAVDETATIIETGI